jgi:tRNA(Ile)-lysidine synthase
VGSADHCSVATVRAALARTVPPGALALVAVSGGPDSTALLYLATQARPDLRLVAGHVRHGLRDDAQDAEIAAGHAAALGLAFLHRFVNVDAGAPEGLEAAARTARYEALGDMAREAGARFLLVGHTADDQAETVVLNLARGSGLRGVGGIPEVRAAGDGITVVRPLLGLERAVVRAVCAQRGLRVADDPTNADVGRRRARARHETLPLLAQLTGHPEGTRGLVQTLNRFAALARDDADALDALAQAEAARFLVAWGPARAVPVGPLAALPRALASRVVRRMLAEVCASGTQGLDAETVWRLLELGPGHALHVPTGAWVTAGGGWLAAVPTGCADLPERSLTLPGETAITELGAVLLTSPAVDDCDDELSPPGMRGCERRTTVPAAADLVVRSRRPGDRMGGRPLADVLAPVPRALRGLVPVIARGHDVHWVAGARGTPVAGGVAVALVRNS